MSSTLYLPERDLRWRTGVFFGSKFSRSSGSIATFGHLPILSMSASTGWSRRTSGSAVADLPGLFESAPLLSSPRTTARGEDSASRRNRRRHRDQRNADRRGRSGPHGESAMAGLPRLRGHPEFAVDREIPRSDAEYLRILTGVRRDTQAPVILSAIFKIGCASTFRPTTAQRPSRRHHGEGRPGKRPTRHGAQIRAGEGWRSTSARGSSREPCHHRGRGRARLAGEGPDARNRRQPSLACRLGRGPHASWGRHRATATRADIHEAHESLLVPR
jgi:hypothetical protein